MTTSNNRLGIGLIAAGVIAVLAFFGGRYSVVGPAPAEAVPEAAAGRERRPIKVSPEALALMDIEVLEPRRGGLSTPLVAPGIITGTPAGSAIVTARVSGSVARVEKRLGDRVKKGDALAQISSKDAATLRGQQQTAEARLTQARANLARERQLFGQRVTPRQDLEAAEASAAAAEAEAQAARAASGALRFAADGRTLVLTSPIDGRVTQVAAVVGAFVDADAELFHIVDPRQVQAQVALTAAGSAEVAVGDAARLVTQRGENLQATVLSVSTAIDARTGAAAAVLSVADAATLPSVGEGVRAYLQPHATSASDLIVPAESVQMLDGREVVFVRTEDGFRAQPVSLGARNGAQVAVRQGLTGKEALAGRNAFLLKAEADKGAGDDE